MGRQVPIIVCLLLSLAHAAFAQEAVNAPLSRVITDARFTLKLPVESCTIPDLTAFIARHLAAPVGVEYLPGPCVRRNGPVTDEIALIGRPFQEALDLLVKADSRYHWVDADGVAVLRPLDAWNKEDHFLHETVQRVELNEQNIGAALDAILPTAIGNGHGEQIASGWDASKLILSAPISRIEALDAVVRAHGRLRWEVKYCLPEIAGDVAMVHLFTFDDRGLGGRGGASPRGPDGKPIDRCRQK